MFDFCDKINEEKNTLFSQNLYFFFHQGIQSYQKIIQIDSIKNEVIFFFYENGSVFNLKVKFFHFKF